MRANGASRTVDGASSQLRGQGVLVVVLGGPWLPSGNHQDEHRAPVDLLGANFAVVRVDDAFHHREAEAGAAGFGGEEWLE
jgi:hypothetical protein